MNAEYEEYLKDKRISCQYGIKCYQKNPAHHEKYKHPPKRKGNNSRFSTKKFKGNTKVIVTKNASDSEEEDSLRNQNKATESDSDNNTESDDNSDSATSTENEDKKVNNDVSDSDSGSISDNSNDAEELAGEQLDTSEQKQKCVDVQESSSAVKTEKNDNPLVKEWADFIRDKFLVTMPEDFYQFWDFCKKLNPKNPSEALRDVNLYFVGPFDVLQGKFSNVNKSESEYLIHWRFYRDPPEMQTVLRSNDPAGYHIGYFRDSPEELPVMLVSNSPKKSGIVTQMGGNIFSAVNIYLDGLKKSGNPFKKMFIGKIQKSLLEEAERLGIDMTKKSKEMIQREKKIVTRSFNKIGLVVPYDKKTGQGYRSLALDNKALDSYLTKLANSKTQEDKEACLSGLQPVFTYASIAADECDFGTGIELGWNIISHGVDCLNSIAERYLASNYRLLNRDAFAKIAEAHMRNRKDSLNLSIL